MPLPRFDQDLSLGERVEDLAAKQFIAQRPVCAFTIVFVSWRSGSDVERLHADFR